jgi:hypothetical protein
MSSGDPAKMLELVEESLDPVSEIGLGIMRDLNFLVPFGWNHDLDLGALDHRPPRIGIVSLVGDNATGGGDIVRVTAGQDEMQWPTFSVRDGVDFAGQSSFGAPRSLIFGTFSVRCLLAGTWTDLYLL